MNSTRIGVLGLGFGQYHVRTLANMGDIRVVAVADFAAENLDAIAQQYGAAAYRDGLEMLEKEHLDAVSLCVSPRWRAPLIEKAAQLGIPMFVEKPWASTLDHAHQLANLCQQHNAIVMTGFSFRYLPAIVRLRELMDQELGAGWLLSGDYVFDWLPPADFWLWDAQNGGGYFNENSCHLFDAVCYLLGEPVSVMAEGVVFRDSPSEEAAAITLRFESGAIAALTVGGLGAGAIRRFPRIDLVTANGQVHLDGREHIWESLTWATRNSATTHTFAAPPELLDHTRYTYALHHFIDCVRTGQSPTATIQHGVRAVAIAEAVYESARTGRKVPIARYDA